MVTENKKYVPTLRFPEFQNDGEWNYEYGNMLYDSIVNKKHKSDLPILAITQDNGAIPRDEINYRVVVDDKSIEGYKIVEIGDFIISLRSFQGGIEYSRYKGLCSPAYIVLRKKHSKICDNFYRHYFKSFQYIQALNRNLEGIRDGKMVSYKQFSDIKLPYPSLVEQKKIADCLSSLDKYIDATKRKLELLKEYKNGLMQRLFPAKSKTVPELRFPEFQNDDKWEWKKLEEFLYEHKTKSDGKCEVHSVSVSKGVINQKMYLGRSFAASDTSNYKLVKPNDVIYTKSPTGNFPFGIVKQSFLDYNVIVSPLYAVYSPTNRYVGYLIQAYFESPIRLNNYLYPIVKKGAKNTIQITNEEFLSREICLPSNENEQQKIADCLSSLDNAIAALENKTFELEIHKKGLLQQIFPNNII
ncbi:MAG: restriction endonuclease subunit S [Bacteroidaceae bacterium]|nr:restriction endonuclease subunit S [Bacteroidaceae bacterium]